MGCPNLQPLPELRLLPQAPEPLPFPAASRERHCPQWPDPGNAVSPERHSSPWERHCPQWPAYTEVGSRESQILPNGITTLYAYDNLNRLTNLTHTNASDDILAEFAYTLAPTGRRTGVTERLRQPDAILAERMVQYTYDQLNRLTQETSEYVVPPSGGPAPGHEFTTDYIYNLVGNRLAKSTTRNQDGVAETIAYAFNANDQLLAEISNINGQTDYSYSANGELISKIAPDASYAYTYNLDGRMSGATITRVEKDTHGTSHNIAISATYAYNQSGIRTHATSTTQINAQPGYTTDRVFLIDSANHTGYAQVLEEFTGLNPAPVKSYVLGDDVLADSGKYLLYDGHGSTRALSDTSGTVTDRYSYDAYGQMLGGQPNITNPASTDLTYSGEQFDPELQMNYHRARYYDMSAGIWNRLDPFSGNHSDPQSLHKYAYCHGDPVNGVDPSGESETSLVSQMAVTGIISFLSTFAVESIANVFATQKRSLKQIFISSLISGFVGALAGPFFSQIAKGFSGTVAAKLFPHVAAWGELVLRIATLGLMRATIATAAAVYKQFIENQQLIAWPDVVALFVINLVVSTGFTSIEQGWLGREVERLAEEVKNVDRLFWRNWMDHRAQGIYYSFDRAIRSNTLGHLFVVWQVPGLIGGVLTTFISDISSFIIDTASKMEI